LIVDDHAAIRRGVQSILNSDSQVQVIGMAENGEEAVKMAGELKPDLVVMDVSMPKMNGIEACRQILTGNPEVKIILLTLHDGPEWVELGIGAGARGYLLKSETEGELLRAVEIVRSGELYVSPSFDPSVRERVHNRPH
jgi:DNA-binding NarL/FixJ family response regulator